MSICASHERTSAAAISVRPWCSRSRRYIPRVLDRWTALWFCNRLHLTPLHSELSECQQAIQPFHRLKAKISATTLFSLARVGNCLGLSKILSCSLFIVLTYQLMHSIFENSSHQFTWNDQVHDLYHHYCLLHVMLEAVIFFPEASGYFCLNRAQGCFHLGLLWSKRGHLGAQDALDLVLWLWWSQRAACFRQLVAFLA